MDALTLFGLASVSLMLAFYAFEDVSHWCVLGFAAACVLASTYGFLQGAWPFGVVEGIWAFIALKRFQKRRLAGSPSKMSAPSQVGKPSQSKVAAK